MALNADVVEAVVNANFKIVAEGSTVALNLAAGAAVGHQQRMTLLAEATVGTTAKRIAEQDIAQSLGEVAIAQSLVKGAQTTPPPTA